MSIFDVVLVVLLAVFTAIGAWRGFVRELVALLTWVAAVAVAWLFAADLAGRFAALTAEPALRQAFAFIAIFAVVFALGTVAGLMLNRLVRARQGLRLANVLLGGLVGTLRGVSVIVIAFLVAGLTSIPQRDWWRAALLTPQFERAALFASGYIPRDVARHIRYG
jgi:membrane protein required for colicin V production